jgi:hypothetical protein
MIKEYTKFVAGVGQDRAEFIIDPKPDQELRVKITVKGQETSIPFKDLYSFVFFTATEDQQAELMPVKRTVVNKIIKRHVVAAKKDIRKGEMINFRCETNVPVEIFEGIAAERRLRNPTTHAISNIPIIGQK